MVVAGGKGGKRNRKRNKQGKGEQLQVPLGVTESAENTTPINNEKSEERK